MDTTNTSPPSPKDPKEPMRSTGYIVAGLMVFIVAVILLGVVSAIS